MPSYMTDFVVLATLLSSAIAEIHRTHPSVSPSHSRHSQETSSHAALLSSLAATCLVALAGIAPLLFIPLQTGAALRDKGSDAAHTLQNFLSFAVGALLGDVFLHLLPEAYQAMDTENHSDSLKIGLWILAGLVSFMIIEMLMNEEEEGEGEEGELENNQKQSEGVNKMCLTPLAVTNNRDKKESNKRSVNQSKANSQPLSSPPSKISVSGYLNLLANVIDNFTHGLAVGGSYSTSLGLGHVTTLAILLHEIPHEISDFAILLRAGFDRWGAAKAQILTASGCLIGTLVGFHGSTLIGSTSWILPFTSGGFLYISLVTVLPDLLNREDTLSSALKQIAFILLGIGSMGLVSLLHTS